MVYFILCDRPIYVRPVNTKMLYLTKGVHIVHSGDQKIVAWWEYPI